MWRQVGLIYSIRMNLTMLQAVARLGLRHVVITSVDRDDFNDGGANVSCPDNAAIRLSSPETTTEVLTPDFLRSCC